MSSPSGNSENVILDDLKRSQYNKNHWMYSSSRNSNHGKIVVSESEDFEHHFGDYIILWQTLPWTIEKGRHQKRRHDSHCRFHLVFETSDHETLVTAPVGLSLTPDCAPPDGRTVKIPVGPAWSVDLGVEGRRSLGQLIGHDIRIIDARHLASLDKVGKQDNHMKQMRSMRLSRPLQKQFESYTAKNVECFKYSQLFGDLKECLATTFSFLHFLHFGFWKFAIFVILTPCHLFFLCLYISLSKKISKIVMYYCIFNCWNFQKQSICFAPIMGLLKFERKKNGTKKGHFGKQGFGYSIVVIFKKKMLPYWVY